MPSSLLSGLTSSQEALPAPIPAPPHSAVLQFFIVYITLATVKSHTLLIGGICFAPVVSAERGIVVFWRITGLSHKRCAFDSELSCAHLQYCLQLVPEVG